jgi:3-oxoacyl-[acyl-carrier protein] reductase
MSNLQGKVVVVTGGGRGLGLTAAEAILRAGAAVSIWDVNPRALEAAGAELAAQRLTVHLRQVDITDLAAVQAAQAAVGSDLGPVDALLNNAALKLDFMGRPDREGDWKPGFWELDPDRFRRLVEVNIIGTYQCARTFAPTMIERGRGSIMNVSTSPTTRISKDHVPYGASKSFIESFTLAAAEQLRPYGVRMNAILPGGMVNFRDHDRGGKPFDTLVPLTLYLAGDESAHVTGQVISAIDFNRDGASSPAAAGI